VRDALSLLDQMLAFGGGKVGEADARAMLGTIERSHVMQLLELLAAGDAAGLMGRVASMDEHGPDYAQVLDELASLLQKVALRQAIPDLPDDEVWGGEELAGLVASLPAEDLQLFYQVAILGRRDLPLAPEPRSGFEMVLLRMLAFRPDAEGNAPPANHGRRPQTTPSARAQKPAPATVPDVPAAATVELGNWSAVLEQLKLRGAVRQLASHCSFVALDGDLLRLRLDARGQALQTRQQEERLLKALSALLGRELQLDFEVTEEAGETPAREREREDQARLDQARLALDSDPTVQALKDRFGAVVQPDSIKPAG